MTITATIPADTCPNAPTVTDHEGNVYNTVQIGNQCWTRENMRCKTLPKTGEALQSPYSNYSNYTPYFYKAPASDSVRLYTYGYLYNSSGQQLAKDDDGGEGRNFLIGYPMTE